MGFEFSTYFLATLAIMVEMVVMVAKVIMVAMVIIVAMVDMISMVTRVSQKMNNPFLWAGLRNHIVSMYEEPKYQFSEFLDTY